MHLCTIYRINGRNINLIIINCYFIMTQFTWCHDQKNLGCTYWWAMSLCVIWQFVFAFCSATWGKLFDGIIYTNNKWKRIMCSRVTLLPWFRLWILLVKNQTEWINVLHTKTHCTWLRGTWVMHPWGCITCSAYCCSFPPSFTLL